MKIGIITLLGNNYGNRLQNYAVQEILKDYGDVYTVPYEKKIINVDKKNKIQKLNPLYIKKALDSRLLNIYHLSNRDMNFFDRLKYYKNHKSEIHNGLVLRNEAFNSFDNKYINYEKNILHLSGDDNLPWVKSYDAWICGSDQIWNPHYPTATRNSFLQFAPKERRISFSASIGISGVSNMPKEYKNWLEGITYCSVREDEAADIVLKLTGKKVNVFLDPTMILPKEKWDMMADQSKGELPEKFALNYFLGVKEKAYVRFIDNDILSKNLNRIDMLSGEYPEYLDLAPDQIVNAIKKADIIYTDSFHGVVFSIIFHKQFIVFERSEEGLSMNSRLKTLLKKFNLENRIYNDKNKDDLKQKINYSKVDDIISKEQKRVKEFLDLAFKNIASLPQQMNEDISKKYIKIDRKEHCYGCTACSKICPKQCINMEADGEGFLYPKINLDICINCGMCSKVCPFYNQQTNTIKHVYAAINNNSDVRYNSSSGGTFYQICKEVINNKGIVFGVGWNNQMVATHMNAETMEEIKKFQGSKYVQSNPANSFYEVKNELKKGRQVLFSGTPCQVAGLKNYLGKDYDNLLLIDVLCHGTPSPKLLKEYICMMEEKYSSKIIDINLRDKKKSWHRLHTNIKFSNGKNHFIFCGYDTYMSMFLTNMSQRPSCFECKFTTDERQGDITLGDFWGIGKHNYNMDDDKGTSMIIINTDKGNKMWESIKDEFRYIESDFITAESGNKVLVESPKKNFNRDAFYKSFEEEGYKVATAKYVNIPSKTKQMYYDTMRFCLDIYRKIRRQKY